MFLFPVNALKINSTKNLLISFQLILLTIDLYKDPNNIIIGIPLMYSMNYKDADFLQVLNYDIQACLPEAKNAVVT